MVADVLVIEARELTKVYGDLRAVDSITFDVPAGESFGLLGPNGAGKSTTMRMIGGTSLRTSGSLLVNGMDPEVQGPEVRANLGVVPQQDNLDAELRVRDNLIMYGRYFGLPYSYLRPKADELLEFAQLADKAATKVDNLSGGMKRRLTIARALVNEPRVLLLDEPTTGLDATARRNLVTHIRRIVATTGLAVLWATHLVEEVADADRIALLIRGEVKAVLPPAALIAQADAADLTEAYVILTGPKQTG
jgi:lipooligosaccharide transport system ATP-binding protein